MELARIQRGMDKPREPDAVGRRGGDRSVALRWPYATGAQYVYADAAMKCVLMLQAINR